MPSRGRQKALSEIGTVGSAKICLLPFYLRAELRKSMDDKSPPPPPPPGEKSSNGRHLKPDKHGYICN